MLKTISHLRSRLALRRPLIHPFVHLPPPLQSPLNPSSFHFLSTFSQKLRRQHQGDELNEEPNRPPRLFVVQPRLRPDTLLRTKLEEALNLANSLEEQRNGYYDTEFSEKELPPHVVVQNPVARCPRADTFFRTGTLDTVKCHLNASDSKDEVDAVFVNASLTGIQQRNLERIWGKPVLDRVGLIIEIFNAHAQTKEAKLQAELAALMYKKSRLVRVRGPGGRYTFGATGEAEVVSARGRGSGGRGFISGAGETELQLQRRRISERRIQLLSEIKEVRRTRALQRAARKRHGSEDGRDMATVAIVGYTNAGKSTLVSALSDTYLYCDDRLFATVDPKLRSIILPSGRKVLLSDTVGFISDLPVQLVEAFHATLEEVVEADLLVHVLDSSAPNLNEQRDTVLQVLEQLGVSGEKLHNMIEVWNKIDIQDKEFGDDGYIAKARDKYTSMEDEDVSYDELSGDEDMKSEVSEEVEEGAEDQQGYCSDQWLSTEEDFWVDYDGSSVGQDTPDNQQMEVANSWKAAARVCHSASESSAHIKASAITGVGLQELLILIDERLQNEEVQDRNILNRKWRPPRTGGTGVAVEQ